MDRPTTARTAGEPSASRVSAPRLAAGAGAALAAAVAFWSGSPAALDPQALAGLAAGGLGAGLAVAAGARRRGDAQRRRLATESAQRACASEAAAVGARELSRVLDSLPVQVARYDRDFRYRYANRAYRRFFGLDPHRELRGVAVAEVIGREGFEFVRPYFVQALAGAASGYRRMVTTAAGERWIQAWLMPDHDPADAEIGGVLIAAVDITARRLAEERAIHARARLRDALQGLDDGFVLFDADDRLVACNDRYTQIYPGLHDGVRAGASFEDIVRDVAHRGLVADLDGREEAWIAARLAQHRAADGSHEELLADGRWLRVSEKRTSDGGTVGLHVDITELRRSHLRIEAGMRMLEKTVEHLPVGVSVIDEHMRFAAFNDVFLRLYGLEAAGLRVGDPLERAYRTLALRGEYGPGDPDTLVAARMALARERHAHRFERVRPDGRIVEVTRNPYPGGGFVTIYADVTERKAFERRIIEAREHAEAAARAKSEFVASVSEEIRTPLNGVLGLADLLLQSRLDPAQRRHLEWLQRSARMLLVTLGRLLDPSELASAGRAVVHAAFDLRAALDEEATAGAARAHGRNLSFVARIGATVPAQVLGDGMRLRQVLGHLLLNAFKYTSSGEVALEADCRKVAGGTARIAFRVRDTGIGMPQSLRERLFAPLADDTDGAPRSPEAGLLACRRLVEGMGGLLEADSAPGRGTEFRFELSLPLAPAAAGDSATPALPGPSRTRVLVVEDCPITREMTQALLERHGIEVSAALDGREALARFTEQRFDLVLMDVELPGLDGIAATRAMRALEASGAPRTPIVALTASAQADKRAACFAAGMDTFLAKPVEPQALLLAIEPYLPAIVRRRMASPQGRPAIDRGVFDALGELMGESMPQLVSAYADSARAHAAELRRALADPDPAALSRPAHTLKSSSANLGATTLTALAGQLEAIARSGRPDGAAALVDEIDQALERVCAEIGAPAARAAETADATR